jgi:hypothetical protein
LKYPAVGRGYFVRRQRKFASDTYESEQVAVEYPVCRKHYFWSLGMVSRQNLPKKGYTKQYVNKWERR